MSSIAVPRLPNPLLAVPLSIHTIGPNPSSLDASGYQKALCRLLSVLLLLTLQAANMLYAAELQISSVQGYPGDEVEITFSLQGDGVTSSARFEIHTYTLNFSELPPVYLADGASCMFDQWGIGLTVQWNAAPRTDLIEVCTVKANIRHVDSVLNGIISTRSTQCTDVNLNPTECSVQRGHVRVLDALALSFVAVLREPPASPSLADVVAFNYANMGADPPLGFTQAPRPQTVRREISSSPSSAFGQWILHNPASSITRLHDYGARFTYARLEDWEVAIDAARHDPAVREVIEQLTPAGPRRTYPTRIREHESFALFLLGLSCPPLGIETPDSRDVDIDGNDIYLSLDLIDFDGVCPGVPPPGYTYAIVNMPSLPAGRYTLHFSGGGQWPLVVLGSAPSSSVAVSIPLDDVPLWLLLGVLCIIATKRQRL